MISSRSRRLSEFGIVIAQGIRQIAVRLPEILEDASNSLPDTFRQLLQRLGEHLKELDRQVTELEQDIQHWHRGNADSRRLSEIPGIGPITASDLTAWRGLVPRQHSSGGKSTLQGISKQGDNYFRTLLIHGARAVVRYVKEKTG
ncbi:transposase (fragment) [Xenorhabdus bovienii str. kraussei Becker Underwood]|uniref:Transposase n=1 Tax=Xenorhabdus bovienii str. kraussei Becker Underwood TaxID=1398204 RepID=A0A077PZ10_XENBV